MLGEHRRGQRHATLLVALANDPDQAVLAVDRRHFERGRLADAQATRIHQQEADPGDRPPHAADDGAGLGVGQNAGQAAALGRTDLFFENSAQSRSSVRT